MDNTSISGSPDCHGSNKLGEIQIIWGSTKKALLFIGLALAVIVFELDNSTTPSYSIYAATAFGKLSTVTAISTLANIVMASVKPIFATLADTCGRIEIYNITILFYIIGYCLCAAAQSFGVYVTGYFFYIIGQSGTNLLNNIIASDFSSVKWRAFAIQSIYSPVIFMPFVSGFILDNVVGGIGWRWGIGMFAIIMPLGVSLLIFMAFYLQYRTQKPEFFPWKISSTYGFYKNVDIVGIILISGGTALLLCPISWVGVFQDRWNVPWVYVLVGVGALMLGAAYIYEKQFTSRPFIPVNYFTDRTILLTCLLILLDRIAFWVTHVYMYVWLVVTHNFSAQNALYVTYINTSFQYLAGLATGWAIRQRCRYKWGSVTGSVIRCIGYGLMLRLRGSNVGMTELLLVQIVQGLGTGMMESSNLVAAQVFFLVLHWQR